MRPDIREKIKKEISAYGQYVVCVGAPVDSPSDVLPFTYTIGNFKVAMPELLLIGWCDEVAVRIINTLGRLQRDRGMGFRSGETVNYSAKFTARLMDTGPKGLDEYALWVDGYYERKDVKVYQVLLSDQNGKFAGESGCLPPYSEQPLLYRIH